MKIIDVSIPISNDMVYFPGDPNPQISRVYSIEKGEVANVSKLILSSHTGTHIDAPAHFIKNGNTVDKIPLERLIGKVRVLDVGEEDSITKKFLESKNIQYNERIFFKTKNSWYLKRDTKFFKNFVYLSVDAAEYLVEKKVEVVGIDYLSIEEFNSKNFPVHRLLLSNDVVIVEGLCLLDVNEGRYKYIALPLKIEECDGAPARVILIEG
ncbi:Arylformamidase [Caldicellulosiruptor owensensis OL]|uniref:Kynurenine formamidase n=1 Tax=Caldicellulosiruptor owensensis (strain ATCC 700167 / DSM 13100 / OL) TaxID=632518 RepID=E4Q3Y6_CALOW|nr:cyclase family protein [Caldicellulosiruptor owensensis]ADQ04021.1 Arylformamidase [Caldicellulosiruptor owensensis OL]